MSLLSDLVATSARVGATSARLAKVRELAAYLRTLPADEIEIGVRYLSGETLQGRFGMGYAVLRSSSEGAVALEPTLSLTETNQRLADIAGIKGAGSAARRSEALHELFARAIADEKEFLIRLLIGEIRQGALAGVMVDAIAAASDKPVAQVRRAAMYAKSLGAVARAALLESPDGLAQFQLEMLSPVVPMLAQTAADVTEALAELAPAEIAFE